MSPAKLTTEEIRDRLTELKGHFGSIRDSL